MLTLLVTRDAPASRLLARDAGSPGLGALFLERVEEAGRLLKLRLECSCERSHRRLEGTGKLCEQNLSRRQLRDLFHLLGLENLVLHDAELEGRLLVVILGKLAEGLRRGGRILVARDLTGTSNAEQYQFILTLNLFDELAARGGP